MQFSELRGIDHCVQCDQGSSDPMHDFVYLYISVNYKALIIACSVVGGLLILDLTLCICKFH